MDVQDIIRKHALGNALKYEGKANPGAVIGKLIGEMPDLKKDMKSLAQHVNAAIKEINSLGLPAIQKEVEEKYPELLEKKEAKERTLHELANAHPGKVITRFAPYPSGPLHIGNARPAVLNDEYAKKYDGKMLLVLDDTIGSEEKQIAPEAYDLIPEGLAWLGVKWAGQVIYKSDRLAIYYDHARRLIQMGEAYVCTCPFQTLRLNREKGLDCLCRAQSRDDADAGFTKMLDGFYAEGQAALRIKTSMQHPNPAFRDRVLFRISERPHARVGTKYRVWPLLEFSWAIDDHLLGITHVLRGKDLMIETDMERHIWKLFGWDDREVIHHGLLSIEGVKISKSKSGKEVASGAYGGWDDPRTWSLQSLHRRGITPQAIRTFVLSFGVNANEIVVPVENLYSENRKVIEHDAQRFFFVKDPVELRVDGAPHVHSHLRKHPTRDELGSREMDSNGQFYVQRDDKDAIVEGALVRLMDCINFTRHGERFVFDSQGVDEYRARGKRIMHWLPVSEGLVPTTVLLPDGSEDKGLAEPGVRSLASGTVIQFERYGFCRFDRIEDGKAVFWFAHK